MVVSEWNRVFVVILVSVRNRCIAMICIAYRMMLMLMVMIHPAESKPRVVMIGTRPRHQEGGGEESSYQLVTE